MSKFPGRLMSGRFPEDHRTNAIRWQTVVSKILEAVPGASELLHPSRPDAGDGGIPSVEAGLVTARTSCLRYQQRTWNDSGSSWRHQLEHGAADYRARRRRSLLKIGRAVCSWAKQKPPNPAGLGGFELTYGGTRRSRRPWYWLCTRRRVPTWPSGRSCPIPIAWACRSH